jgi:DNA-binding NarL/FixJ family response regulator
MARILVVDDSAVMRRNIIHTLTHAGHEIVAQASDGGQAYNLYKTNSPDLVTMDINMPEVNGIEAVKRIIADFPKAKIIMVSALDQKHMVLEALKCGAKHYIIKPINPENLVVVVNKILGVIPQSAAKAALPQKPEPTTEAPETRKSPVEEEPQSPFIVKNVDATFHIRLTKLLSMDNIGSLVQAIQGLLYVQPLSVAVNFGRVETFPEELLNKIAEINNLIIGANGKLTVTSQNKEFINWVREKHISGLSELFIG